MSDPRRQTTDSVATEAADWYARLRAANVSEMDAVRFRAWLAGDPARRREFEALDVLWSNLAAVENAPEVERTRQAIRARRRAKRSLKMPWAIAASVVLVAIGSAWVWQHRIANQFETAVGEQRTVPLADGSIVTLNTSTQIRVHYSEGKRGVELVRGQANFEVAKDAKRPFIVSTDSGEVRAVGTIFDVYKTADKVTVTLIEGKVAVRPLAQSSRVISLSATNPHHAPVSSAAEGAAAGQEMKQELGAGNPSAAEAEAGLKGSMRIEDGMREGELLLAAGEQLTITPHAVESPKVVDVPRVTAWRARVLDFNDTPIIEAIAEANRYSRDQIVLQAPELAGARFSGTFEAGKNDLLVEGLQAYYHLDVARSGDHRIVLSLPK